MMGLRINTNAASTGSSGSTSALSNIQGVGSLVGGFGALGSAYAQASAIKAQAAYQQRMLAINKMFADMEAADAIKRGEKAATNYKKAAKRLIGSQRAAIAAQGIEVDTGSALEIQEDTAALAAQDAQNIKNNAYRQAFGFKVQAFDLGGKSSIAGLAASNEARNTVLTGGLNAAQYGMRAADYFSR